MTDRNRRSSRSLQSSTPYASRLLQSSLRPSGFLNMLNPMSGRIYQGYMQTNQSVVEEEEDEQDFDPERSTREMLASSRNQTEYWGESSRMKVLGGNSNEVANQIKQDESSDDEVPQSFIIESPYERKHSSRAKRNSSSKSKSTSSRPLLPLSKDDNLSLPPRPSEIDPSDSIPLPIESPRKQIGGLNAYERALWNWVNVYDLDVYLQDVYRYYEGKGIVSIALSRGLHLLTIGFTICFSTFLLHCIDYSRIRHDTTTSLSNVIVERCISRFSGPAILFYLVFGAFYFMQIVSYVFEIRRLVDMYYFYTHLLRIPDVDIQTISWAEIVRRIEAIREENPVTAISSRHRGPSSSMTAKLDAHDIANRIMREENYLIAIFNKDLLDLRVPMPAFLSNSLNLDERHGLTLSTALEYNLRIILMRYLFDGRGRVREVFLKEKNRDALIEELRRRFIFMGIMNAVLAPFIVVYLLMYYFFRYFEEYHKNPSAIGGRRYTLFARWKFREFNELPHVFSRRLDESYQTASMFIGQFPNTKMAHLMRFVSFIAGSFAAILLLASVIDPDLFTHLEITPHRTVLYYLPLFGSIMAISRGMIPENSSIFDPELLMMEVVHYTHYMPDEWKGQLHSQKVHRNFGKLFDMKIMIFIRELLSVVLTPFVLCFSLPKSAHAIIDFFREFTIHVDNLGYVCSFAVFDFKRHGNVNFGTPMKTRSEQLLSKEGKMEKSFLNFKAENPEWQPTDPTSSLYLSRMAELTQVYGHGQDDIPRRRPAIPHIHGYGLSVEQRLAERAQEYDRALRQSRNAALRRRGNVSRMGAPAGEGPSHHAGPGRMTGAVTGTRVADIPDVGTVNESMLNTGQQATGDGLLLESTINPFPSDLKEHPLEEGLIGPQTRRSLDELTHEGEVRSELGESYIDGKVPQGRAIQSFAAQQTDEEQQGEAGMLGLLAHIYGTRPLRGL